MQTYKIQLLSHVKSDTPRFLWLSHPNLEKELNRLKQGQTLSTFNKCLYSTLYKWDRTENLDLFQAKAWQHRLTQLGVECQIVEVDYSKEP